jgi:uncharacterized repeat protein (TIGR01451 family)/CSLREA domain-containing protein
MNSRLRRVVRTGTHPFDTAAVSPRRARRRVVVLGVVLVVLGVVAQAPPAYAAVITVNTLDDELNADGDCSVREAFEAANTNTAVDACPAGVPAPAMDVVDFAVDGTILLSSQLTVTDDLTISAGPSVILSGGGTTRVMVVGTGVIANLLGGTVADGFVSFPDESGGGIFNSGTLTVESSTFSGNSGGGLGGGGIFNHELGTLTVSASTFSGNSGCNGGGIFNDGTAFVLTSDFSGNNAGCSGGGAANRFGILTIDETTLSGNGAASGGAIINTQGTLIVRETTLSGNSSTVRGGAIRHSGTGSTTLTNTTLSGNSVTVGGGGGIRLEGGGSVTLNSATLSGNSSPDPGGGLLNEDGTLTLQNTIVANSPSGGNCSGTITDGGGNLQYPGLDCGATITSADPMLDPAGLQNNGGSTQTIALQPGSPAIDTALLANCPATDQRGVLRPQGAGCDIGAFELEQAAAVADLSLTKTDSPEPVGLKKVLTYTLTVSNGGPSDATAVTVEDELPAQVQFISATPSQGTCTHSGGVVTCSLGSVAAGASATVTIQVRPTARGTITNTAEVSAAEVDPDPANNADSETTTVNGTKPPPPGCKPQPCP